MLKRGSRFGLSCLVLFLFVVYGCQSRHGNGLYKLQSADQAFCREINRRIDFQNRIETLNLIAQAYYNRCYEKVIQHGPKAQSAIAKRPFRLSERPAIFFSPMGP